MSNQNPCTPRTGRPPKPIDWKIFEQLCNIQCTHDEIASFLQVARVTLYERAVKEYGDEDFPTIYKRFAEGGKCSLRRNQFKLSATNAAMAIWLGKQWLGQVDRDKNEQSDIYTLLKHFAAGFTQTPATISDTQQPEKPVVENK